MIDGGRCDGNLMAIDSLMAWQLNDDGRWMTMDGNGRRDGDLTVMDSTAMDGMMVTGGQQSAMDGSSTVMDGGRQ